VIGVILLNVFKGKGKAKSGGKQASYNSPRGFSSFTLHRLTGDMGLDREQVKMLDYVMRSGSVSDPERFLNSPDMIDRQFKRTYRLIERTSPDEEELNKRLLVLFSTRNIIDASSKGVAANSGRRIPERVPAVLTVDKVSYPVQVLSSRGGTLSVENPKRVAGSLVHPAKGSKATLSFFTKSAKGFSVETRILGTAVMNQTPVLQLTHSGQIKRLSARHFRRRDVHIDAGFYLAHIDTHTKKTMVEKKRYSGKIADISVGGCSIKVAMPINIGQRIKIEFVHHDDSTIVALGEILRISRSGANSVMHVKFLKVPRRSLVAINAMVYEYAED
jgi:c-di-GMP-binding flagellar brake protein YcgR